MNETATQSKTGAEVVKKQIVFLPFMCENAARFSDIDIALSLMTEEGVRHKQREIWKWAPKKDEKGNPERDNDGKIIMVKVVTRNSKWVTVKSEGGLVSFLPNGAVEPMDGKDVQEVIEILKQSKQ
jgi:hypothetical protein